MIYSIYIQAAFIAISAGGVIASPAPKSWTRDAQPQLEKRVKIPMLPLYFPPNSGCDQTQQVFIIKTFQNVLDMIDNVLDTTTPDSLAFRTFFDNKQDGKAFGQIGTQPTAEEKEAQEFPEPEGSDGNFSAEEAAAAAHPKPAPVSGAGGGASSDPILNSKSVLPAVKAVFNEMKTFLTTPNQLQMTCGTSRGDCKGSSLFGLIPSNVRAEAFKRETPKRINFCSAFFDKSVSYSSLVCKNGQLDYQKAGMTGPAGIEALFALPERQVLHEMSHLTTPPAATKVKGVEDCFYNAYSAEFLANWDPAVAISNADNYGWFGLAQHLSTICGPKTPNTRDYFRSWADVGSGKGIFKVGHMGEQLSENKANLDFFSTQLRALAAKPAPSESKKQAIEQKIHDKMAATGQSPDLLINICKGLKLYEDFKTFGDVEVLMDRRQGNRT